MMILLVLHCCSALAQPTNLQLTYMHVYMSNSMWIQVDDFAGCNKVREFILEVIDFDL